MFTKIGEISEGIPLVTPDTQCGVVNSLFKQDPKLEGVAIADKDGHPQLLMRSRFYQQIGTQYGYNLYMGRPVRLVIHTQPLVVDYDEAITDVSIQAMNRSNEELYDGVLVTREGQLHGAVSIRNLLLAVADLRAEMAIFLNPLTGLPGNRIIDDRLNQSVGQECFSVLYIDLDHFKTYNDSYGFKLGDQLIQATAGLLRKHFAEDFLGHIGGDDFIAILNHHDFEPRCRQVIGEFEKLKQLFYNEEDWNNQYVMGEARNGDYVQMPLTSISIAVVTNRFGSFKHMDEIVDNATRIKKVCKAHPGSVSYADSRLESFRP
ncbi:GGDEF domain-containing protein [Paenibacillus pinistramenti]|uniref:GGDEF domain-containing protein n=1 Tax=Paenibacillus pinistramenti TaxID=1768003 RepID=UPI001108BF4F|nr:GGDEF domain-containing protein [Paenibacillus pinistramenti]